MSFQKYINDSWAQHEKATDQVVASYDQGLQYIQTEEDVLGMSRLISHIATDHNFRFDAAIMALTKVKKHPLAQSPSVYSQLDRQIATAKYIMDQKEDVSQFSISDRTIIFISASASFLFQKNFGRSESLLNTAVAASHSLQDDKDPAFRSLAMCTNNMAAELSERMVLNAHEKRWMIDLAKYARQYWEKAGTWLQVERAEYYISKYFFKIGDYDQAEAHAKLCLQICEKENADPLEHFFGHERLVFSYRAKKNTIEQRRHLEQMRNFFKQCTPENQSWMQKSLDEVER